MSTRGDDFQKIKRALGSSIRNSVPNAFAAEGDSLRLVRKLPSNSISLILTDPPYHATKKQNIYGDTHFEEDTHYLEWMAEFAKEWRRVLRPNGSLFCFCDSSMAARLEVEFSSSFNVLAHVVWTKPNDPGFDGWKGKMKKEALRQWYPHSERLIFAEPAVEGNLHRSSFAHFLRESRKVSGLSQHELTEMVGAYGKVNHGGAVSNWEAGRNTPSREQYEKICSALLSTGKLEALPPYEDVVRVFNMDASKEFTDVWTFPSVRPYKGKHPAEKPIAMLEHAIEATTLPGDIVLDCFAGSGSTLTAALNLNRRAIGIEIDPRWVDSISMRLDVASVQASTRTAKDESSTAKKQLNAPQLRLFSGVK
jgi:adenine-specific DNA-methyltransferase